MQSDLFKTDVERFFFLLFVSFNDLEILRRCNTDNGLERFDDFVIVYVLVCLSDFAALKASYGFDDSSVTLIELKSDGVEIIYFSDFFKWFDLQFG